MHGSLLHGRSLRGRAMRSRFKAKLNVGLRESQIGEVADIECCPLSARSGGVLNADGRVWNEAEPRGYMTSATSVGDDPTRPPLLQRDTDLDAKSYFFTRTIRGLSFAALLWTTNALPFALALSLRAR